MIATGEEGKAAVEAARGNIAKTEISTSITVGGQDTLEGADYFWFWTYTILVTAVLFVPVGYLYQEKSYIQTEREGEHETPESDDGKSSVPNSPGDD